jgi:hypothetical protein
MQSLPSNTVDVDVVDVDVDVDVEGGAKPQLCGTK